MRAANERSKLVLNPRVVQAHPEVLMVRAFGVQSLSHTSARSPLPVPGVVLHQTHNAAQRADDRSEDGVSVADVLVTDPGSGACRPPLSYQRAGGPAR